MSEDANAIDYTQWRALHKAILKTIFRSEARWYPTTDARATRFRTSAFSVIHLLFIYLMFGSFCAILVSSAIPPVGEFLAITVIAYVSLTMFLSGSVTSFLSKQTLDSLGVLPITSATFLASHFSSDCVRLAILNILIACPTLFVIDFADGLLTGFGWVLSIIFCTVSLYFLATLALVVFLRLATFSVSRIVSITLNVGIYILFMSLLAVFAAQDYTLGDIGESWNLRGNHLLLLFPPYWFLCLYQLFAGTINPTILIGTTLAVFGFIPVTLYLFSRFNTQFLADASEELATRSAHEEVSRVKFPMIARVSRWWHSDTKSVWRVAHTHLKYDASIRSTLFSYLPVILLFFLVVPVIKGFISDPFVDSETEGTAQYFLSAALFLAGFAIIDACRQSQQYRAAWVLFMSPIKFSSYTVAIVDWIFIVLILPFLVILVFVFGFLFESFLHALLLATTLGCQTYLVMSLKVIFKPIMPFTENLSAARRLGIALLSLLFAIAAAGLISSTVSDWVYRDYSSCLYGLLIVGAMCIGLRHLVRIRSDLKYRDIELAW